MCNDTCIQLLPALQATLQPISCHFCPNQSHRWLLGAVRGDLKGLRPSMYKLVEME